MCWFANFFKTLHKIPSLHGTGGLTAPHRSLCSKTGQLFSILSVLFSVLDMKASCVPCLVVWLWAWRGRTGPWNPKLGLLLSSLE